MERVNVSRRQIGVCYRDGNSFVRVWAPSAQEVLLVSDGLRCPLKKEPFGYWAGALPLSPGDAYRFELDGRLLNDPASLSQPQGVHEASVVVDTSFPWTDGSWQNPRLQEYIFYELHTGTFTEQGNFEGVGKMLDYLGELGITAIELMPLAQFPGQRNWGYDGVYPFAVQHSYGGPKGLQQLVDQCHRKGIAVVLDVVYNHLGPEGNYCNAFGPYFTDKYKTPWGAALNFDDAGADAVRDYYIENVLMWFRDFHVDALRLDAVHAIKDLSARHILQEMRVAVDELCASTGRKHYLIIECDLNDRRYLDSLDGNGYAMDAQWNDEFHHALRVCAGIARHGYYADFGGLEDLAKAYRNAYVYDGIYSEQRQRTFGSSADGLDGSRFIVFAQNHDQVGNRMLGERSSVLHGFEMCKVMAAAVMTSPFLPMLFMGEEWGSRRPFLYFTHHSDEELVKAVCEGRHEEFRHFVGQDECPSPQAESSFTESVLDWSEKDKGEHRRLLLFHQHLIALRKRLPSLHNGDRKSLDVSVAGDLIVLRRNAGTQALLCVLNFTRQQQQFSGDVPIGAELLLDSASAEWGGPGSLQATQSSLIYLQPESVLIYA